MGLTPQPTHDASHDADPVVAFRTADGAQLSVAAKPGQSVMESALNGAIPGIIAECGGAATCATCHVYVDAPWLDRLPEPDEFERGTLEFVYRPRPNSRLSCQIEMTADLDGLSVEVPEAQG